MTQITLKVTTQGALLDGKAPRIIQANLDGFVTEVTMFLWAEVKKRTPQGVFGAQGGLLGSIQADVVGKGTPMVKGTVMSAQKYAEVIEKGRTPGKGMPPEGTLVRWLEVKLGLSETEAKRIEFVVRRKIGVKGFKGRFMFEKSVTENLGTLDAIAERYGLKIAVELDG
jgi:hypothetical protein